MMTSSIKYRTKRLDEEDVYDGGSIDNERIIERLKLLESRIRVLWQRRLGSKERMIIREKN
ncbi:MAG TPA: hypothetical protein P5136_01305 [Methanofastidiosum sp.]|nr:hypothetical protein [Methanofastidiosum sp.]